VKLDDKRALNAKLRAVGLEARGLDEAAMCWAAHQESDGFISDDDVILIATAHGCKKGIEVANKLVDCGRWELDSIGGGYQIHDYLNYNPSASQLADERKRREEKRAVARERMRTVRANKTGTVQENTA
jgi:hypothetical protein